LLTWLPIKMVLQSATLKVLLIVQEIPSGRSVIHSTETRRWTMLSF